MTNFLTQGKQNCRSLWYRYAEGQTILLAAEDMSDARVLVNKGCYLLVPENDRTKCIEKRKFNIGTVIHADFSPCISNRFRTFIPDLQVGWCKYTETLVKRVCKNASHTVDYPTILFLTVCRFPNRLERFGTDKEKARYMTTQRTLPNVREALERTMWNASCVFVPIPNSIFKYRGTTTGKATKHGPEMFHFGYKIVKTEKTDA